MILIGISPSVSSRSASLVVLQKRLKSLMKRYEILDLAKVGLAVLEPECARLSGDPSLNRKKRLYSQDRRPRKTVQSRPRLVFDATETGDGTVTALRSQGICVEAIRIAGESPWQKAPFGRALGDNYRVPEIDLVDTLIRIVDSRRLVLPEDLTATEGLFEAIERVRKEGRLGIPNPDSRAAARIRALALPLWFRETVPYSRAYRAT